MKRGRNESGIKEDQGLRRSTGIKEVHEVVFAHHALRVFYCYRNQESEVGRRCVSARGGHRGVVNNPAGELLNKHTFGRQKCPGGGSREGAPYDRR
jgi:hypothetical protein